MISNIYFENILNFKKDFELNFEVRKQNNINSNTYVFGKSSITINNINVVYGKNNVGKTNLLKSMKNIIDCISDGSTLNKLLVLKSSGTDDEYSSFEIVVISKNNEYRYGVKFSTTEIIDEWLYARLNNSPRETRIIERSSLFFSEKLVNYKLLRKMEIKKDQLILNSFTTFSESVIEEFKAILENSIYVSSHEDIVARAEILDYIVDNPELIERVSEELRYIDVDMKRVEIKRYDEEYMEWFKDSIMNNKKTITKEKLEKLKKKGIPHFGFKDSDKERNYSIDFIDKDDNVFSIHEISFGTKSYFNTLITVLGWINKPNGILFIDEIEIGLHFELLNKILNVINSNCGNDTQVIISTHASLVLDLDFIANDSKILLRSNSFGVEADYVSNYKLKREHKVSRRYEFNVFDTAPKVI